MSFMFQLFSFQNVNKMKHVEFALAVFTIKKPKSLPVVITFILIAYPDGQMIKNKEPAPTAVKTYSRLTNVEIEVLTSKSKTLYLHSPFPILAIL